jgi:hypothetical protein
LNRDFNILFRRSVGNLHIKLSGKFNGMCAWELIKTISRHYSRLGRVFVNTSGLDEVLAEGKELFKSLMPMGCMPPGSLYFKGEKGFEIAPNGTRVLICKRPGKIKGSCCKVLK